MSGVCRLLLVEEALHLRQGESLLAGDEIQNGRVEIARSRAHDQPFERGEAHRGVHRVTAANGARRCAVAEVEGDEARVFARAAGELTESVRDVPM